MALTYFLAPPGPFRGYDWDGSASRAVWRMQVPVNERVEILLAGGDDLEVSSNNPEVVPNDGFDEKCRSDGLRSLWLFGRTPGISMLEAKLGCSSVCFLQVKVGSGAPVKSAATKELNLVGEFEWKPKLTDAQLQTELAAGRWSPGTDDFIAVPGGTVPVAPTFGNMLGAIFTQPKGSISRLNLFTHANKDLIGFGGWIEQRTVGPADVFINTNGQGDNLTAMDPTSMANLNQPGVFFETGTGASKKKVTVQEIRSRFAQDAMIVLYACHSGQLMTFVKTIATFFGVKVVGFKVNIVYFPPAQNTPGKFVRTGMKIGLAGGSAAPDWRKLISDPQAITATP